MRLVRLARSLVAVSSAALGLLGLTFSDFAPLGHVFPGSAWLLLLASALCFLPTPLPSVWIIGGYEVVWAILSTSQIRASPFSLGAWYGFCEAMSSLVAPAILYFAYRSDSTERVLTAARIVFGFTCVFYGASHFAYADYTASMVPMWLPGRLGLAWFTGVAHVVAGICLTVSLIPRLAATLEAVMMTLFGLLVWVPTFFMQPRPKWATPAGNQWSELVVNLLLATSAWLLAVALSPMVRSVASPTISDFPKSGVERRIK